MKDKVTERALTNQTKYIYIYIYTKREMLMLTAHCTKLQNKMWNEDGLCAAVVNEAHNKQTIFSQFSVFGIVGVAFWLSPSYRVAALRVIFRSESLLVAKSFFLFTHFIFNILFAACCLPSFSPTYTHYTIRLFASFFAVDWFGWKFVNCCVLRCVRLIIFDSSGQSEKKNIWKMEPA